MGPIELGVKLHLEGCKLWKKSIYDPDNALVIGTGIFTNTNLYGGHRFVAVFKSPLTRDLDVIAMGCATYQFNVNADAIVIEGKSNKPLIIKIYDEGYWEVKFDFEEINEDELENIWRDYRG